MRYGKIFVSALLVNLATASWSHASTIVASSCSFASVSSAVASAVDGDIVSIPACAETDWTTTLTITKGITLQGAGEGLTILGDNISKGGTSCSGGGPLIAWSVSSPKSFRLTALTIVGVSTDPTVCQKGHVTVGGSSHKMRVDHVTINPPQTVGVYVSGDIWGVIDHFTFQGGNHFQNAIRVEHINWNGTSGDSWGDRSWAAPINYGSAEGVYIEDSTFNYNFGSADTVGNSIDCFSGGRIIYRHNVSTQSNITTHGADSDQRHRGCRWMEIYNNSFSYTNIGGLAFVAWIRGGTGVFYNNTVTAANYANNTVEAANCRDADAGCGGGPSYTPWGACDGTSPYDQNTPGQVGHLCVDQPGSGTSDLVSGSGGVKVNNTADPIYVWNNLQNGSAKNRITGSINVVSGRDFFSGTARPGYTPYVYPHPLTGGPTAPTNLRVVP
jgi:hypothetical protein